MQNIKTICILLTTTLLLLTGSCAEKNAEQLTSLTSDKTESSVSDNTEASSEETADISTYKNTPTPMGNTLDISTGPENTCAIATNNKVYCWGNNASGQLGNGTNTPSSTPVAVYRGGVLKGKDIRSVDATAAGRTCVVSSDNHAYCWGYNRNGGLGDGTDIDRNVPVAVNMVGPLSGKTIKSISVGDWSTCAIASDDKAYCWGSNAYGLLGAGLSSMAWNSYQFQPVPVKMDGVLSGKTIKSISVSDSAACVVASDNKPYCWGTGYNEPIALNMGVLSNKTIKILSTGSNSICVVASDDKAYCWPKTWQQGNLPTKQPAEVIMSGVLNGQTVRAITTGEMTNCFIASDNKAYCWGANDHGQCGNGTFSSSCPITPVIMTGAMSGKLIDNIIDSGFYHVCTVTRDKFAYCWGRNNNGQLGNGTISNAVGEPVAVSPYPGPFPVDVTPHYNGTPDDVTISQ